MISSPRVDVFYIFKEVIIMSRYEEPAPWDDGEYGTGRTQPPKSHSGIIAVLLIAVIVLTGTITLLGFMNIRMFQQLNRQEAVQDVNICFDTGAASLDETAVTSGGLMQIDASQTTAPTTPAVQFPPLAAETTGLTLQEIYVKCIPSVVSITSESRSGTSTGTGVILTEEGYVVTNHHVIENGERITVQLTDDRVCAARLVGTDKTSDLAVLQINADGLTSAEFGDSDVLRVGDSVVAIGDPLGVEYRGTMTDGIVSAINRNVNVNGRPMNLIQTNAALNSGNSGGPLINSCGQVIGINTIKIGAFADSAGVEGLGFAIPSTTVKDIVEQIISQGYVSGRPWLGISGESISLFYQRYYRLPSGLYISEVASGSNAARAGLSVGDILISVDGTKVYSQSDLDTLLYHYSAGDTVTIIIYRGGYTMQADIVLEEAGTAGATAQ